MVTILLAMTEKEIVQFFINQNNQIIDWFIGIIIGIFSILLVIFGLIQWHLSHVKIDDLKNAINDEYHLSKINNFDERIASLENTSTQVMKLNVQLEDLLENLMKATTQNQQQIQVMNQNTLNSLSTIYVTLLIDVIGNIITNANLDLKHLELQLTQILGYLQTILDTVPSNETLKIILNTNTSLFMRLQHENLNSNSINTLNQIHRCISKDDRFKNKDLHAEYQSFIRGSEYINTK